MERKRPQLSLDDLQLLKWLLGGLLALSGIWTVLYMELDTWAILLPATLVVVAGMAWPRLPGRIPGWVQVMGFPAIVAVFLGDLWFNRQVLPAMIRLDVMLIVLRCATYRARRDDLQLIVLGLFLIVVAGVLTVSLAFAAQIVAFTACGLGFLFTITLVDAAEAVYPAPRTPWFTLGLRTATPAWTERVDFWRMFSRLRQASDWRLWVIGGLFFGGVVAVSALLFLSIPRFQWENSLFLDRFIARKARSGFTENIRYGDVTDIISDNSLAVTVDFTNPAGVPATPYLRMVVLDEYVDGGFRMSNLLKGRTGMDRFRNASRIEGEQRYQPGSNEAWTVYFEPGISRYLPIPGSYLDLAFTETQNVSAGPLLRMVQLQVEPASMVAYRVRGVSTASTLADARFAATLAQAPRNPDGTVTNFPRHELNLGQVSEAGRAALAAAIQELTGGLTPAEVRRLTPIEFARRACEWLAERHTYSLQSELPGAGEDPLVRWIGGTTPGHCELFAGAFVVLAREAGFPARMVTGFKGGTWNAFTRQSLTVRNNNAHAWCEIWDGQGGWLRVDPTPGSSAVTETTAAVAKRFDNSWAARLDSLRILWYRRVVNFDQGTQVQTLLNLKNATQQGGQRLRTFLEELIAGVKAWVRGPWSARRIGGIAAAAVALALLAWAGHTWGRRWRWNAGTSAGGRRIDPVRSEAGRWLVRMAEQGWRPEAGGGRREDGGRKTDDGGPTTDDGERTVAQLMRLRYASPATWPKPDGVFRDARRVVRAARKR